MLFRNDIKLDIDLISFIKEIKQINNYVVLASQLPQVFSTCQRNQEIESYHYRSRDNTIHKPHQFINPIPEISPKR